MSETPPPLPKPPPLLPPPLPAHMGYRMLALAMDAFLVVVLSGLIIKALTIPSFSEEEHAAFRQLVVEIEAMQGQSLSPDEAAHSLTLAPELEEAFFSLILSVIITFWAYFSLSEFWMHGATLGKRMVSLRTIRLPDRYYPTFIQCFLRGGIKSMSLLALFSLPDIFSGNLMSLMLAVLAADYVFAFFNPSRRTLHCILTRTSVVEPTRMSFLDEIA